MAYCDFGGNHQKLCFNPDHAPKMREQERFLGQAIEALRKISEAFGQHSMMSTATQGERDEALKRAMEAYNRFGYPVIEEYEGKR